MAEISSRLSTALADRYGRARRPAEARRFDVMDIAEFAKAENGVK